MTYGLREMNGRVVELCDECDFDGREDTDIASRLAAGLSTLMSLVVRRGSQSRPAEGAWSGVEYGEHVVEVTAGILGGCRGLDDSDGVTLTEHATCLISLGCWTPVQAGFAGRAPL